MIGVEDDRLQQTLDIIKEHSYRRNATISSPIVPSAEIGDNTTPPINVTIGGATVFVANLEEFHKY
jgi:uncharacterized protein YaaQ